MNWSLNQPLLFDFFGRVCVLVLFFEPWTFPSCQSPLIWKRFDMSLYEHKWMLGKSTAPQIPESSPPHSLLFFFLLVLVGIESNTSHLHSTTEPHSQPFRVLEILPSICYQLGDSDSVYFYLLLQIDVTTSFVISCDNGLWSISWLGERPQD